MPPLPRRALLSTAAATAAGLAGCNALSSTGPGEHSRSEDGLDGRSLFLADGVAFPAVDGVTEVTDAADADLAVFPAEESAVERVAAALAEDTPAAVAGEHAQLILMRACRRADRSHGFASDSWGSDTRVAAAVPRTGTLSTHLFVDARGSADLPWALGEVFDPAAGDCTHPVESPALAGSIRIGTARVRGRNDAAGFDRRDRVWTVPDADRTAMIVEQEATILAGEADEGDAAYRADRVELVAEFDQAVAAVGPGTVDGDGLSISQSGGTGGGPGTVSHAFEPTAEGTRRSFTACQRARVSAETVAAPFSYTANARFQWRDSRLLGDDLRNHHTPGQAVWYP